MEKVSIIIPCYNMGAYIQRAISSALAQQSQDIAVEVIVVDDGSSDGAFDDATAFSHVRLLRQNNQGSAAARNTGLEIAQGDYLIFLDADDILPRGVVASQLQALTTHPDWDLSVCISLQIQEDTLATYFWPLRAAHLDLHLCHKTITPCIRFFCAKRQPQRLAVLTLSCGPVMITIFSCAACVQANILASMPTRSFSTGCTREASHAIRQILLGMRPSFARRLRKSSAMPKHFPQTAKPLAFRPMPRAA